MQSALPPRFTHTRSLASMMRISVRNPVAGSIVLSDVCLDPSDFVRTLRQHVEKAAGKPCRLLSADGALLEAGNTLEECGVADSDMVQAVFRKEPRIVAIPCCADELQVLDVFNGSIVHVGTSTVAAGGYCKWLCGYSLGGSVFGTPDEADCILVFDPETGVVGGIDTSTLARGPNKWADVVEFEGKLSGMPSNADSIFILDSVSRSVSGIDVSGVATGDEKWSSAVVLDGKIYGAPYSAEHMLVVDTRTGSASGIDTSRAATGDRKRSMRRCTAYKRTQIAY